MNHHCEEKDCDNCSEKTSTFSHKEYYKNILNNVFAEWYMFEHEKTIMITKSKPFVLLAIEQCRYDEFIKITFKDDYNEF